MAIAVQSHAINSYHSALARTDASAPLDASQEVTDAGLDQVQLSGLDKLFEYVADKFDVQRMARRDRTALASELFSLGLIDHSAHQMLASVGSSEAGEINLSTTMTKVVDMLPFSQQQVAERLVIVTQNLLAARLPRQ
ncbi:hypothetical protein [Salinibius halmophilus]|uniref:hypothetical protein n=1 Tax=Salinibius halmophilus TaxID=1853216 RepID=UPI000E66315B|nr:hypothetical protein [Salinibius halmophilus]